MLLRLLYTIESLGVVLEVQLPEPSPRNSDMVLEEWGPGVSSLEQHTRQLGHTLKNPNVGGLWAMPRDMNYE